MLIFTFLWISQVSSPIIAYWTTTYYRDVLGSREFQQIDDETSLAFWLSSSIKDMLFPEHRSSLLVGKLCIVEYFASEVPCSR